VLIFSQAFDYSLTNLLKANSSIWQTSYHVSRQVGSKVSPMSLANSIL
jgi:hypothetical protein